MEVADWCVKQQATDETQDRIAEAAMQQRMARQAEAPQGDEEVDTTPVLPSRYTSAPRQGQAGGNGGDGSQRPSVPPNFRRGGA